MKLLKLCVIVAFFLNVTFSFSQTNFSGIVNYETSINGRKMSDYINGKRKKIKNKQLIKTLDKVFLNTKSIKSTLLFSNKEGVFSVVDKMNLDKKDLAQKIIRIYSGGSKIYYYNDATKNYLIKDCESVGECLIYDNTLLEWELTQESKIINGYTSYKATRSKGKVIAWYTPVIPVNFGPKGEFGLPGLILELEVGKVIFNATKIVLNPKKQPKVEKPTNGKLVSKEEYNKIIQKAKENVFGKGN